MSRLKRLVQRVTPPSLVRLWRRLWDRPRTWVPPRFTWEGIYPDFRAVPKSGGGYEAEHHVRETLHKTRLVLEASPADASLPRENVPEHSLLPLLCAVIGWQKGSVSVLDFGGGAGVDFVHVRNAMARQVAIDYHVVELPPLCALAPALFPDERRIHFHSEVPDAPGSFDVVHVSSALQYVEDYAGLLGRLCLLRPHFLLFTTLAAGNFPTYATAQVNLQGAVIPYWFLNLGEVRSICGRYGFSLIFRGLMTYCYDQSNFPEVYRMGRACNLLFASHEPAV